MSAWLPLLVKASYFAAALLFILGIKRMASPVTARSGIQWAGVGMLLATAATFFYPGLHVQNLWLIALAVALGTAAAWISGKRVAMTDMPQMVALYNGMGGGSAAAIGAVELMKFSAAGRAPSQTALVLGVVGALIGSISLTGSIIAWAKLDGRMDRRFTFPGQQLFNGAVFSARGRAGHRHGLPVAATVDHRLLRRGARVRRLDDAADRRRRHAGGDFAL
jgi:NAD(P) transhydrogenase subunit beta